jgi:hypothetical protein
MSTRTRTIAFAATVAMLVPASIASAAKAISITMNDQLGDAIGGASDIRGASIRDDGAGTVTFRFDLADRTQLVGDDVTSLFVDADLNPQTGHEGDEYVISAWASDRTIEVSRWDGAKWADAGDTSVSTSDGMNISINNRDLGGTTEFAVWFQTGRESDDNAWDGVGPIPFFVGPAKPTQLEVTSLVLRPAKPKAGKQLVVDAVVETDTKQVVTSGTVACAATIGGKAVKTRGAGHFVVLPATAKTPETGSAVCAWNIPRGAAGKTIRGTITVTAEGLKVTRSFNARIGR